MELNPIDKLIFDSLQNHETITLSGFGGIDYYPHVIGRTQDPERERSDGHLSAGSGPNNGGRADTHSGRGRICCGIVAPLPVQKQLANV